MAYLDGEPDRRTLFATDFDFDELWNADNVQAIWLQVAACNRNGFDRLIHGTRANCLYVRMLMLSNHTRDGARHRRGP